MSLLVNRRIKGDVQLGVWKIEETTGELLQMLNLTAMEEKIFNQLKTDQRRKQWLSYRITIKRLLNLDKILDINYDRYGKPMILNHYLRISVTHSGDFSAAILHKKKSTGIDIEKISPRIHSIKHKFLSDRELSHIHQENDTELLTAYWAAKEALYKLQKFGQISLKDHIYIYPFDIKSDTIICGRISYRGREKKLSLSRE
ncbi:MAG: 4'-phosphopantetheinyl transferase family protein, partial [Bacteroidota bacterium]